jgi:hypothetical protein
VLDATPSTYRRLLARLQPGDTLQLAPGSYDQSLPLGHLRGTASQPIVIRGTGDGTVLRAQQCCNAVQLEDTSYVEVRDLTLDGGGLDGPFAVDSRGTCDHITLEGLRIVHYGANQQDVAISTKGPAWGWVIRGNTIEGAGTGMYLGNSDGTRPFVAGTIEDNLILDTRGYNIEIKHQDARPAGVGLPEGASRTVIRYNVFSKSRNASTGGDSRPNLLVGHWPLSGAGANDLYEIYGNFFYENPTEALFQGEGNISLHDNVFVNTLGDAIAILPHNAAPRNITIVHNTVIARGHGIRFVGPEAGFIQRIASNAVFAAVPITGPNPSDNLAAEYSAAAQWLEAPFTSLGTLDLHPRAALVARLRPEAARLEPPEADVDFDGCSRVSHAPGAYDRVSNPRAWPLALARRVTGSRDCPQSPL